MLLEVLANIRDVVVIIYGITTTVLMLAILLMAFLIFRKINSTLKSIKKTVHNLETFSRNVLRPAAYGGAAAKPLFKILGWMKGDKDEEVKQPVQEKSR